MNDRERFLAVMRFAPVDRVPYSFGGPREATMSAWHYQGLKRGVNLREATGADDWRGLPVDMLPLPRFDQVTLQEYDDKRIWIDELGTTRLDHKNPATPGFVTRTWLDFPVKTRADFAQMKRRYSADAPGRFGPDWPAYVAANGTDRRHVIRGTVYGPFWRVRDWVGFEGLCTLFHDDPAFVEEMFEFVADFTIATFDERVDDLAIDFVIISEDMAYKTASMISPAMVRKFMLPHYRRIADAFGKHGVQNIVVDSDGHVSELIPIWIEAGFQGSWPTEIAAGNDPLAYRKRFGKHIVHFGGIDKRELRFDFATVKREVMSKVPELLQLGGYVPMVDHGVPPDIPVRNFLYMGELIKAVAEGRDVDRVTIDKYDDILGPVEEEWSMDLAERIVMADTMDEGS
ncbi:MAG: uroporphyrinogen decarboxylase family protein [Anaerolineae bacterium]